MNKKSYFLFIFLFCMSSIAKTQPSDSCDFGPLNFVLSSTEAKVMLQTISDVAERILEESRNTELTEIEARTNTATELIDYLNENQFNLQHPKILRIICKILLVTRNIGENETTTQRLPSPA